jgi:alkaline phosphatase D
MNREYMQSRIGIKTTVLIGWMVGVSQLSFTAPEIAGAELLAGPMIGHITPTSARIWVETDRPAEIQINYWEEPRLLYDSMVRQPIRRGSAGGRTAGNFPHTGIVELAELNPGWLIHYDLLVDGRPVRALSPQVFSLFPPETQDEEKPDDPGQFSVAFGSCNFPSRIPIQPIWAQIVRRRPIAFLFIGDNNYMPNVPEAFEAEESDIRYMIADTHRTLRNVTGVRELMASTASYGIWDDHDYGPGDSDRTFRHKEISLSTFRRYWPNPKPSGGSVSGVYHSFRVGDVAFFMLDDRFNRDPNKAEDRSTMLGASQLQWLKDGLMASDATFKVIANGGTMLVDEGKETWHRFGAERDDFLAWLFKEEIDGVFFIAGDWHIGVLNRRFRPGDGYPLYELLSSNIAVKIIPRDTVEIAEGSGNNQWISPRYIDFNFGLMRFSGVQGDRTAKLQLIAENGEIITELALHESDLRVGEGVD